MEMQSRKVELNYRCLDGFLATFYLLLDIGRPMKFPYTLNILLFKQEKDSFLCFRIIHPKIKPLIQRIKTSFLNHQVA